VLGKPFISELRALGEQFDEYIRRFQRYKPELKFDAATPEARQQASHAFAACLLRRRLVPSLAVCAQHREDGGARQAGARCGV
jgi:hypothetical protein